jgi:HEAT repeat protein
MFTFQSNLPIIDTLFILAAARSRDDCKRNMEHGTFHHNPRMKRWLKSRWLWLALLVVFLALAALLFVDRSVNNVMHPALDKLAALQLSERWSNPELLKIRELGPKAIPPLRRVLREKDNPTIQFLLWVKKKWPGAVKYYSHFPDPAKISERRWTACQVLQTLGPAGKPALPEILKILESKDMREMNAATMALYAIGIDADVCDRLDALLEKGIPDIARSQVVGALGNVKPPSARTLKSLTDALADASPHVQNRAAQSLGQLGVSTPEVVSALKHLQSTSGDLLVVVSSSAALWELEKNSALVLPTLFKVLENELTTYTSFSFGSGGGGQGVSASDQVFMQAGWLFHKMNLADPDKSRALRILASCCEKSGRVFIRMLLLEPMLELGYPADKSVAVCRDGLGSKEDYYRIQAAQLLASVARKHPLDGLDLDALIHDPEVGVRVYAAKVHWLKNHDARALVPVLIESLDRAKHQSYYYAEIQPAALTLLGEIGPAARDAIAPLEKILTDPNPAIVKLATETLAKIRK